MVEESGELIEIIAEDGEELSVEFIQKYELGSITSKLYPRPGAITDWAYGAGWDKFSTDATMSQCKPITEPTLDETFF